MKKRRARCLRRSMTWSAISIAETYSLSPRSDTATVAKSNGWSSGQRRVARCRQTGSQAAEEYDRERPVND